MSRLDYLEEQLSKIASLEAKVKTLESVAAFCNKTAAKNQGRAEGRPKNCIDLFYNHGYNQKGFYAVQSGTTVDKIEMIYCEFDQDSPGGAKFCFQFHYFPISILFDILGITDRIGFVIKTHVHFSVQRSTIYSTTNSIIPWQIELVNVGGGMSTWTGVFTAPQPGIYTFSYIGSKAEIPSIRSIQLI